MGEPTNSKTWLVYRKAHNIPLQICPTMTMTSYASLPIADGASYTTPPPAKRLSMSHAVATSINSAKTTIGNKARSLIPKIAQLTTPVKRKGGCGAVADEASTPVLLYLDTGVIMQQKFACGAATNNATLVDPFSFEGLDTSPRSSGEQIACDDFSFRPTRLFR
jgi:hypothetical protein